MSYFVTKEFPAIRASGIGTHPSSQQQLNPDRQKRGMTHEEVMMEKSEPIEHQTKEGDFLTKKLTPKDQICHQRSGPATDRKFKSSDIFGPPTDIPKRSPRLRENSDMMLIQVQSKDVEKNKKDAAILMQQPPTFVEKMLTAIHPIPHPNPQAKKHTKMVEHAVFPECEVPGMTRMGILCKPAHQFGLKTRSLDYDAKDFVQELPPRTKMLSPRSRNLDVFNPINGEKNVWYGRNAPTSETK